VSNSGDFTLTNSLIQGNTAGSSAGLANGLVGAGKNTATLINVTVSGNVTSGSSAGGVQSDKGSVTLTYCTIVGNQGGGVSTDGGNITMKNSIVAGNVPKNCPTFVTTNGFNIADDSSCPFNGVGDQENVDPSLGPLADNGGPTLSYMPQAGSPAIDTAQCLLDTTTDQRGAPRPFGDACDVGAVEYGAQVPGAQAMPLPESQLAFAPASSSTPVLNIDPALANPIGIGTVAADGDTLDIRIGTIGFSGPADVYFAVYSPQVLGSDILLYTGTAFVTLSQAGLVPWMASTTGPVDQDLFGAISISLLPSGVYTLFFAVAPDGSQLATFYLWSASFTVP
jgi:hypothetical protein